MHTGEMPPTARQHRKKNERSHKQSLRSEEGTCPATHGEVARRKEAQRKDAKG